MSKTDRPFRFKEHPRSPASARRILEELGVTRAEERAVEKKLKDLGLIEPTTPRVANKKVPSRDVAATRKYATRAGGVTKRKKSASRRRAR